MNDIRYLLDEHIDPRVRKGVKRLIAAITIWCIGDAGVPARGTLDAEILRWCESNSFILVTDNRKSMPAHLQDHIMAGGHIPGIFVLRPVSGIGEIIDELILIWEASFPDEYQDQIRYLPISG